MDTSKKAISDITASALGIYYTGKKREALELILDLIKKYPASLDLKMLFARLAEDAGSDVPTSDQFSNALVACLDENLGDARKLLFTAGAVLFRDIEFSKALSFLAAEDIDTIQNAMHHGKLRPLLKNNLLQGLLRNVMLNSPDVEIALRKLRQLILFTISETDDETELSKDIGTQFCSSLAIQCKINEYIYFLSDEEKHRLEQIRSNIESTLKSQPEVVNSIETSLLVIALYQPLHELNVEPAFWSVSAELWPPSLRPLITSVYQHYEENRIRMDIPALGIINNDVSLAVKGQYEENPYPRWANIPAVQKTSFGRHLTHNHPHFHAPDFLHQPVRLLVAGCGTGQEVISAHAVWNTSQILAIDLSRSSLAYAIRMTRELGIADHIDFRQADILELSNLPEHYRDFDVICSSGVLHHMEDPLAGWRTLTKLLRPGGIMKISLYSQLARRNILKARKIIAAEGIPPDLEGIRQFRRNIFSSKQPELHGLTLISDLYTTSTCRDLLFHTHECQFCIEDIKRHLSDLGFTFIGFEGILSAKKDYRRMFPGDPNMTNLDNWSIFETQHPDTFISMYDINAQKL